MEIKDIIALCIGGAILIAVIIYIALRQREKVIEWLKYAVTEAERILGSKTGQLKLRMVYDGFCEQFPVIAALVPFRVFSAWTDTALETLKDWLKTNKNVRTYIEEGVNADISERQP